MVHARYTLLTALAAIGVDAERLQLLGDTADVGLTYDVAKEIHLAHELRFLRIVDGIRSIGQDEKVSAGNNSGNGIGGTQIPDRAALEVRCHGTNAARQGF